MERQPCVYILATACNGTLYVGVTSDLVRRVAQHRAGIFGGFTAEKNIKRLVYWEMAATMEAAITREKAIKRWRRDWKRNLIERDNPNWNDLAIGLGFEPLPSSSGTVDPGTSPG
ncbi:endonuclease [Sphingomonas sp. Leaf16]|nr:endonuclease [Sphingomonas sp. Leaf16]KQN13251.1 endonuclease [Sphingomonas sp. Leaf29]KQN20136.1 endonuclease [Sphingomonas sp. Leaf32]